MRSLYARGGDDGCLPDGRRTRDGMRTDSAQNGWLAKMRFMQGEQAGEAYNVAVFEGQEGSPG